MRVSANNRVPPWVESRNVCYEIGDLPYQDFFTREGLPEHHALYDARANAYAFRERVVPSEVTGGVMILLLDFDGVLHELDRSMGLFSNEGHLA